MGTPGPTLMGHACRWAFSQTSGTSSAEAQAISTRSNGTAPARIRRNTSATSASRPPARNIVSVPSFLAGGASRGLSRNASRSASEVGDGAIACRHPLRAARRRGISSPGISGIAAASRVPGSASSNLRSRGAQMIPRSSIRTSVGSPGHMSPCWSASPYTAAVSASRCAIRCSSYAPRRARSSACFSPLGNASRARSAAVSPAMRSSRMAAHSASAILGCSARCRK